MAKYAVYEYHSSHWNILDSTHFTSLSRSCMQIIIGTAHTMVAPYNGFDPLKYFKEMLLVLSELLDTLKEDPVGLEPFVILYLCGDIHTLVIAQPSLKQYLGKCVEALLALHMHSYQPVQLSEEVLSWAEDFQYHDKFSALCRMYDLALPETLPLLSLLHPESLAPNVNHSDSTSFYTVYNNADSQNSSTSLTFNSSDLIHLPSRNSTVSQGSSSYSTAVGPDSAHHTVHNDPDAQASSRS